MLILRVLAFLLILQITSPLKLPMHPANSHSHVFSVRKQTKVPRSRSDTLSTQSSSRLRDAASLSIASFLPISPLFPSSASAAISIPLSTGQFDPNNFKPVCSASDGLYRALQGATQGIIGPDNYIEYGPLIAGGLLRVRLELCVVESFFNEAVLPFVRQNGLSWVLPLHETVEVRCWGKERKNGLVTLTKDV